MGKTLQILKKLKEITNEIEQHVSEIDHFLEEISNVTYNDEGVEDNWKFQEPGTIINLDKDKLSDL